MNQESALLVMVALAIALLALMAWGWRRRTRRDAHALSAVHDLPEGAIVHARYPGTYIGTTRQDQPLQRLAAPGLGLRAHATIVVADAGIALDLAGAQRIVLPADRLVAATLATTALDSVVEKDGLVRLTWRTDPGFLVDTYLRAQDASAHALAESIRPLIHTTRTGSDA